MRSSPAVAYLWVDKRASRRLTSRVVGKQEVMPWTGSNFRVARHPTGPEDGRLSNASKALAECATISRELAGEDNNKLTSQTSQ
jgi:hypothetical protein